MDFTDGFAWQLLLCCEHMTAVCSEKILPAAMAQYNFHQIHQVYLRSESVTIPLTQAYYDSTRGETQEVKVSSIFIMKKIKKKERHSTAEKLNRKWHIAGLNNKYSQRVGVHTAVFRAVKSLCNARQSWDEALQPRETKRCTCVLSL